MIDLKEEFEERFKFKNIKFSQLNNLKLKNENVKGVIFDLGYSYAQIKDPNKGLSFDSVGKLNMQLGLNSYSAELKDCSIYNKLNPKYLACKAGNVIKDTANYQKKEWSEEKEKINNH